MDGLSASDIALLGNDGNFGGSALIWIFALLILAGGGFGGFGNRGDYGQFATAASQQDILFSSKFEALDNKIDRLGNGIADATFSLNNSILNEARNTQTQMAECCCQIKEAVHAEGEATRNMIQQDKIANLQAQVNNLTMQNAINSATFGTVKYPTSSTWAFNNNPFCSSGCTGLATV